MKQTVRLFCIAIGLFAVTSSWAALTGFDGTTHTLSEFTGKGKWTIVMFWASDCRVCNAEIDQYVHFNNQHKDASIIGVSLDGQAGLDQAKGFVERHHVTFTNLLGDPQTVVDLYQSLTGSDWVGTPSFLVYNPQGKLLAAQAGAVPTELIEKFIKDNSQNDTAPN